MPRKPGSMYRYVKEHACTRKEYTGGIPASRITQFVIGNKTAKFPLQLTLTVNEKCQIRDSSLESARITVNRALEKRIGVTNYRLHILVYPHIILRENKQATGAGADRVSMGMRKAYGKNVGFAARVEEGQTIMTVETTEQFLEPAKDALRRARMKITAPCKVNINTGA